MNVTQAMIKNALHDLTVDSFKRVINSLLVPDGSEGELGFDIGKCSVTVSRQHDEGGERYDDRVYLATVYIDELNTEYSFKYKGSALTSWPLTRQTRKVLSGTGCFTAPVAAFYTMNLLP